LRLTNQESGTSIHAIADGIYLLFTRVTIPGFGFLFNQNLIVDDEPLQFHTGPRKLFPLVCEAAERGSLDEWLPDALCN
jgi:hypothetical protein